MRYVSAVVMTLGFILSSSVLLSHHAIAAKFDASKPVTLKGTVTAIDWANPHVHIFANVSEGNVLTNWSIELDSPIDLQRSGWSKSTLKPGDAITVQGIAA